MDGDVCVCGGIDGGGIVVGIFSALTAPDQSASPKKSAAGAT
jgi:hypothetical protein